MTFRGDTTRSYYGDGPLPVDPRVVWTYPDRAMCADSTAGGVTKEWCGTGWTGQPAVFERDGRTWLVVGACDRHVHFLDGYAGVPRLFVGGENSQLHVVRLNRGYDRAGRVTVKPRLVFNAPGWDDRRLARLGDRNVSIEGSVARVGDTLYFANSGGLVQGWDVSELSDGATPERVFRFWTGDDTDATVVADDDGMLYVASQWQRRTPRAREVGQVLKLDPSRRDPLVWSLYDTGAAVAGVWATPALHGDALYVATDGGELLGVDRRSGALRWRKQLQGPTWSSPVVVDDVLLQGDCSGTLFAYDVSDKAVEPPELWQVPLGGCIESTPAVWRGGIYVGSRAGFVIGLR